MSRKPAPAGSRESAESRNRSGPTAARGIEPVHAGANLLAHDLKGIAGRLGLLAQSLEGRFDDRRFGNTMRDVLEATVTQLERLARELGDREGRLLVPSDVDLNRTLDEALAATRPALCGEIELIERYADLPPLQGDALLLRSAFACAIDNALEAMDGRGTLSVSTSLSLREGRRRVTVEIADDGPGMSAEFVRRKLFEPLSTTKRDGMGMGACSFRQIAALHGGSVRVISGEGRGTRVRFHLPADRV